MTPSPRMHPSSKPMTCKIAEIAEICERKFLSTNRCAPFEHHTRPHRHRHRARPRSAGSLTAGAGGGRHVRCPATHAVPYRGTLPTATHRQHPGPPGIRHPPERCGVRCGARGALWLCHCTSGAVCAARAVCA